MKYLVYDSASDQIAAADVKPPGNIGTTNNELLNGLLEVWHQSDVQPDTVLLAIRVLLARMTKVPFNEITSAVTQITSRYLPDQYAFVALGASPKLIKWILKRKGYETVAINVSKVTAKAKPTVAFEHYVEGKLAKITKNHIVLLDFVQSGESLVVIKSYLSSLWKRGSVAAIALGVGSKFKPDGEHANQIDFIVHGIPQLSADFEANKYKQMIGRSKDMRDFATFPQPVKFGNVMEGQKKQFAAMKSSFARAAELGPIAINLLQFMDIAESESHDSDEESDEKDGQAFGDFLATF